MVLPLLMTACSKDGDTPQLLSEEKPIAVSASITSQEATTRGANDALGDTKEAVPYEQVTPSGDKILDASVWFTTSSGVYGDGGWDAFHQRHTEVKFNSASPVYPYEQSLMYPADGEVFCVGLYPYSSSAWTTNVGNTTATHEINGVDDLMYASQQSAGNKATITVVPTLQFYHLLTWLKIIVKAESNDAVSAWGNITNITVTSPSSGLTVDLAKSISTAGDVITYEEGVVTYNGIPTDIIAFDGSSYTDPGTSATISRSKSLDITDQEIASIFCAPDYRYTVKVTTAHHVEKSVVVTLKDENGIDLTAENYLSKARGHMFVITLYFKDMTVIDAGISLNAWDDNNANTIDLKS